MTDLKQLNKVIMKWKLNKSLLAEKIGMPKTTFSFTISGKKHYKFTPEQFEKLTKVLSKMSDDLKSIQ